MKLNPWTSSVFVVISLCVGLFFGIRNNTTHNDSTPIDLDLITNAQMEEVVEKNPQVLGMRMSLANRYLAEGNFSSALHHYMFISSNDITNEFKPTALAQIGWMTYESGKTMLALEYIKESIRLNPDNILANTYLGIVLLEQDFNKEEGLAILNRVLSSYTLTSLEKEIINEYIEKYDK